MREILCCWLASKIEGTMEQGIRPLGVESDPWLTPKSRRTGKYPWRDGGSEMGSDLW